MKNETKWPDTPFECEVKVTLVYMADRKNRFSVAIDRGVMRGSDSDIAKAIQGGVMAAIAAGVERMFSDSECHTKWEK